MYHPELLTLCVYEVEDPASPDGDDDFLVRPQPPIESISSGALLMMAASIMRTLGTRVGWDFAVERVLSSALNLSDQSFPDAEALDIIPPDRYTTGEEEQEHGDQS